MKLKELIEKLNSIPKEFLDCDVVVDTDAATYTCHLVDICSITKEDAEIFGRDFVVLHLDDSVKEF